MIVLLFHVVAGDLTWQGHTSAEVLKALLSDDTAQFLPVVVFLWGCAAVVCRGRGRTELTEIYHRGSLAAESDCRDHTVHPMG